MSTASISLHNISLRVLMYLEGVWITGNRELRIETCLRSWRKNLSKLLLLPLLRLHSVASQSNSIFSHSVELESIREWLRRERRPCCFLPFRFVTFRVYRDLQGIDLEKS